MMNSVWSFWSKPYEHDRRTAWLSEKQHLLSWALSFETARKHYPNTRLVTDDDGARRLVDGIGLEFETVSTALNAMQDCHPDWWAVGKLHAYRCQRDPFVHIDSDVYLWKRLPTELESADVFTQNPEWFSLEGGSWYRPIAIVEALNAVGGWVPEEWQWYTAQHGNQAACCGVFGGNRIDFIQYYADIGIRSIEDPRNAPGWDRLGGNMADNLFVEQCSIIACIEYYNSMGESRYGPRIGMRYLFDSPEEAFTEERARDAGYTHLIGSAKRDEELAARLERRVQNDYPDRYEACMKYVSDVLKIQDRAG